VHPTLQCDADRDYAYILEIEVNGRHSRTMPLFVPAGESQLRLALASPSPASGTVRLSITVPGSQPVRLDVYDVAGRLVRRLPRGALQGSHVVSWDGSMTVAMMRRRGCISCAWSHAANSRASASYGHVEGINGPRSQGAPFPPGNKSRPSSGRATADVLICQLPLELLSRLEPRPLGRVRPALHSPP
jgi:hypothetical protein